LRGLLFKRRRALSQDSDIALAKSWQKSRRLGKPKIVMHLAEFDKGRHLIPPHNETLAVSVTGVGNSDRLPSRSAAETVA